MTEFKKGDKIRCIDDSRSALLIKDKIYTFNSYKTDDRINIDEIDKFHYPVSNFELITKAETKFKAGDKLVVVEGITHRLPNGKICTMRGTVNVHNCILLEGYGDDDWWSTGRFELVEQNPVVVKPKIIYKVPRLIQIEDEQI